MIAPASQLDSLALPCAQSRLRPPRYNHHKCSLYGLILIDHKAAPIIQWIPSVWFLKEALRTAGDVKPKECGRGWLHKCIPSLHHAYYYSFSVVTTNLSYLVCAPTGCRGYLLTQKSSEACYAHSIPSRTPPRLITRLHRFCGCWSKKSFSRYLGALDVYGNPPDGVSCFRVDVVGHLWRLGHMMSENCTTWNFGYLGGCMYLTKVFDGFISPLIACLRRQQTVHMRDQAGRVQTLLCNCGVSFLTLGKQLLGHDFLDYSLPGCCLTAV